MKQSESKTDKAASQTEMVDCLIDKHQDRERGLIELMQEVSAQLGYLPQTALQRISERLDVPLSRLYSLATFYQDFKLQPQGEHRCDICSGTACHVKGAAAIVDALRREMKLEPGETSEDGKVTLETVNCVGLCGVGPVAIVDGEYHSQLTVEKALSLVKGL